MPATAQLDPLPAHACVMRMVLVARMAQTSMMVMMVVKRTIDEDEEEEEEERG